MISSGLVIFLSVIYMILGMILNVYICNKIPSDEYDVVCWFFFAAVLLGLLYYIITGPLKGKIRFNKTNNQTQNPSQT